MCGISYRKYGTIENVLNTQDQRGLDGIGLLYENDNREFRINKYFVQDQNSWQEATTEDPEVKALFYPDKHFTKAQKVDLYQEILSTQPHLDEDTFVFMHHRKSSIGAISINNTHPFQGNKFILAQNGTSQSIKEWGIVEGVPMENTDTHSLLHYIEKHCETLQDVVDKLEVLTLRGVSIGVACVYSIKEKQLMFFSDAERTLYIEYEENNPQRIKYIQSLKDDSLSTESFETKGFIIVDMKGNVIKERLIDLNKKKVTTPITPYTRYHTATTVKNQEHDYGYDDYWGNIPGGQTSILYHSNTKKKEETKSKKEDKDPRETLGYIPDKESVEELYFFYKDLVQDNPNISPYEIIEDFTLVKQRWSFLVRDIGIHRTEEEKQETQFCYNLMQRIKFFSEEAYNSYVKDLEEMHMEDPEGTPADQIIEEAASIKKMYTETLNFKLL